MAGSVVCGRSRLNTLSVFRVAHVFRASKQAAEWAQFLKSKCVPAAGRDEGEGQAGGGEEGRGEGGPQGHPGVLVNGVQKRGPAL